MNIIILGKSTGIDGGIDISEILIDTPTNRKYARQWKKKDLYNFYMYETVKEKGGK
jgi:hypothetical protein